MSLPKRMVICTTIGLIFSIWACTNDDDQITECLSSGVIEGKINGENWQSTILTIGNRDPFGLLAVRKIKNVRTEELSISSIPKANGRYMLEHFDSHSPKVFYSLINDDAIYADYTIDTSKISFVEVHQVNGDSIHARAVLNLTLNFDSGVLAAVSDHLLIDVLIESSIR